MGTPAAVFPAVRSRAAVDARILPRPTPAAAIRVVGAATPLPTRAAAIPAAPAMPAPTRAAAIPARAATTAADTTVPEPVTFLAGSTPAEAITTVEVSGLVLTLASGSVSPSAGATIRAPVAATMTDTAIGSRPPAIRTSTRVTDRVAVRADGGADPLVGVPSGPGRPRPAAGPTISAPCRAPAGRRGRRPRTGGPPHHSLRVVFRPCPRVCLTPPAPSGD